MNILVLRNQNKKIRNASTQKIVQRSDIIYIIIRVVFHNYLLKMNFFIFVSWVFCFSPATLATIAQITRYETREQQKHFTHDRYSTELYSLMSKFLEIYGSFPKYIPLASIAVIGNLIIFPWLGTFPPTYQQLCLWAHHNGVMGTIHRSLKLSNGQISFRPCNLYQYL